MLTVLTLTACATLLSLALTPVFERLLKHLQIVDHPDDLRKLHGRPVPRAGGIPVALSFALPYLLLLFFDSTAGAPQLRALLAAVTVVFLTGLADDLIGLRPWQKMLGQVAAAGTAYYSGVQITRFGGLSVPEPWSVGLTILWLVGCSNAVNLLDGVDGLACGVGLFGALSTLLAGLLHGNLALVLATAPLAGALLGFLPYNFNPARIFLGDSGSLLIGFLLGCYGVMWSQKSATLLGMTAPLMVLTIPLADTSLAIVRRFLRRRPIFSADREHIHHRLLDRGFSPRRTVLLLYGASSLAAGFSLLLSVSQHRYGGLVIVCFCAYFSALFWLVVSRLEYIEVRLAARMLLYGCFNRETLNSQLCLRTFERAIRTADSVSECWSAVRSISKELGFATVHLRLAGETYQAAFEGASRGDCWNVSIPLSGTDCIELSREFCSPVHEMRFSPLAMTMRDLVRAKVESLQTEMPMTKGSAA